MSFFIRVLERTKTETREKNDNMYSNHTIVIQVNMDNKIHANTDLRESLRRIGGKKKCKHVNIKMMVVLSINNRQDTPMPGQRKTTSCHVGKFYDVRFC
jgi:hypothetical protein